jgi:nicotinamidase-related amidase
MTEHEQVIGVLRAKNAGPIKLDPASTALIVVDMQRYFTQPHFPFTDLFEKMSPGMCSGYLHRVSETVIPNIRRLLDHLRNTGSMIVFTAVGTTTSDGRDLAGWARSLDQAGVSMIGTRVHPPVGDISWQIDEALEPRAGEIIVNKLSAGAFATTNLEKQLRDRGITSVIVAGVVTDVCVSTTAREAADRSFNVVVVNDACTTFSERLHEANLQTLHVFGAVRTTQEVLALATKAAAANES